MDYLNSSILVIAPKYLLLKMFCIFCIGSGIPHFHGYLLVRIVSVRKGDTRGNLRVLEILLCQS